MFKNKSDVLVMLKGRQTNFAKHHFVVFSTALLVKVVVVVRWLVLSI